MKKRFVSAALCAAMVAGSLAGCGLKTPETTTAAATEAAKTEAAKEGETTAEAAAPAESAEAEVTPVSYTHLDVYKRQPLRMWR